MIRVLIVNDSPTSRAAIRLALAEEKDIEVVAELASGRAAVDTAHGLEPDVILMDIMMPELDGYETTRLLRRSVRVPIIMISASVAPGDVAVAMGALRAGAIAVLETPPPPTRADYEHVRRSLVHTVRSAASLPRLRTTDPGVFPSIAPAPAAPTRSRTFDVVGLVASLGGPPIVADLLAALPPEHPPVLLVQHIEPSFVTGFAEWLGTASHRPVRIAQAREPLARGTVFVAPRDHHLRVGTDGLIDISTTPPVSGFRPSADVLLTSLARAFGARALGIVLTGMGRDGADGALALHGAGGYVIAQDEASCAVAGMPNAARNRGAVDLSLSPSAIASYLR